MGQYLERLLSRVLFMFYLYGIRGSCVSPAFYMWAGAGFVSSCWNFRAAVFRGR